MTASTRHTARESGPCARKAPVPVGVWQDAFHRRSHAYSGVCAPRVLVCALQVAPESSGRVGRRSARYSWSRSNISVQVRGAAYRATRAVSRCIGASETIRVIPPWQLSTHGLLAGPAIERLDASPIEKLFMTDSVETQPVEFSHKVEIVSVAGLFAEAIRRIARRESISVLFS